MKKIAIFQNVRGHGHFTLRFPVKREIGENFQMFPFFGGSVNLGKMFFFCMIFGKGKGQGRDTKRWVKEIGGKDEKTTKMKKTCCCVVVFVVAFVVVVLLVVVLVIVPVIVLVIGSCYCSCYWLLLWLFCGCCLPNNTQRSTRKKLVFQSLVALFSFPFLSCFCFCLSFLYFLSFLPSFLSFLPSLLFLLAFFLYFCLFLLFSWCCVVVLVV